MRQSSGNLAKNTGRNREKMSAADRRARLTASRSDDGRMKNTSAKDSSSASFAAMVRKNLSPFFLGRLAKCASTDTRHNTRQACGSGSSETCDVSGAGITTIPAREPERQMNSYGCCVVTRTTVTRIAAQNGARVVELLVGVALALLWVWALIRIGRA